MKTDRVSAEDAYYWTAAAVAVASLAVGLYAFWRFQITDQDRERIIRRFRVLDPLRAFRAHRDQQVKLTWEIIQAQDVLEMYDAGHVDLGAALGVPAGDRP